MSETTSLTPQRESADIGVVGLGVMGANLARNLARHGHEVAVFNRTTARTRRLMERYAQEGTFIPSERLADFTASLRRPRVAVVMVQAGDATQAVIDQLADLLEPGDVVVDAGNTLYTDTRRREAALRERGLHLVGMGVSGGEEGALLGPSIMPGGSAHSYERLGPILESVAATAEDGTPCVTHVGPDGAGHFVKMVHNGIEYADMQLIAEAYDLLRRVGGLSVPEVAGVFRSWRGSELDSYLIDVTAEVLERVDPATGEPFVDVVVDAAGQKGTGAWTTQTALDLGVAVPAIGEAAFARAVSSSPGPRAAVRAARIDPGTTSTPCPAERDAFVDAVRAALYGSKIAAYAQGFDEIAAASARYGWDVSLGDMARIWRAGCIIRARLLDDITRAYRQDPHLVSLLTAPGLLQGLQASLPAWREVVATAARSGVPAPAFCASLAYVDQLRSPRLPAALIQGQRDFFGSHTYHRVDDPEGVYHVLWATPGRAEERWDR